MERSTDCRAGEEGEKTNALRHVEAGRSKEEGTLNSEYVIYPNPTASQQGPKRNKREEGGGGRKGEKGGEWYWKKERLRRKKSFADGNQQP